MKSRTLIRVDAESYYPTGTERGMGQVHEDDVPKLIGDHREEVARRVRAVGVLRDNSEIQQIANMIRSDDSFLDNHYHRIAEALACFENHREKVEPHAADPNGYEDLDFGE